MTDTGAEVSVLSTKVYDKLDLRPPIKQHVTLVQEREWVLTPNLVINNVYSVGSQTEAGIQLSILTAIGDVGHYLALELGQIPRSPYWTVGAIFHSR